MILERWMMSSDWLTYRGEILDPRVIPHNGTPPRTRREFRNLIMSCARQYGFPSVMYIRSDQVGIYIRTRVKYFLKYGNEPATRILIIPSRFVRNLHVIHKRWPELAEFLLYSALWHEYRHLQQEFTYPLNLDGNETEANRFMIEKMGLLSLVVSIWYFTTFRQNLYSVLGIRRRLDKVRCCEDVRYCMRELYPDVVPPGKHDEIVSAVLTLEQEFQGGGLKTSPVNAVIR